MPTIGLGPADFEMLRQQNIYYVDKSRLIVDLLADPNQVVLFPRPRRFGKTLNQSMLRYFLEKSDQDRSGLFQDLEVWRSETARQHFARYPLIFLTFKDVKAESRESCLAAIRLLLAEAYEQHRYLLVGDTLAPEEATQFRALLEGTAGEELCCFSLQLLTKWLARYHGERAVVLIDEYDAPIQCSDTHDFFDKIISFFRSLLSAALKDNRHLFKGVLTGILRIAKESLFSELNNVAVQSILSNYYSDAFGFTEQEVRALAGAMGQPELAEDIARWYNGYRFGEATIYNPWSVLSFAQRPEDGFRPYWVSTSAEDVLRPLVFERQAAVAGGIETLLRGEPLTQEVTEHLVLRDIDRNATAIWSLLLHSGYLTTRSIRMEEDVLSAELVLPNAEMRHVFQRSIRSWMEFALENNPAAIHQMLQAMLDGNEQAFGGYLDILVRRTFSYNDTGGILPERVYQAFLLGLLVYLAESHEVRSNQESGLGRYDVRVCPRRPGLPGVVIECKRLQPDETVEHALASALKQIKTKDYESDLVAREASPIHSYGLVFDGKQVWVRKAGRRRRTRPAGGSGTARGQRKKGE